MSCAGQPIPRAAVAIALAAGLTLLGAGGARGETLEEMNAEARDLTIRDTGPCGEGISLLGVRMEGPGGIYKLSPKSPLLIAFGDNREKLSRALGQLSEATQRRDALQAKVEGAEEAITDANAAIAYLTRTKADPAKIAAEQKIIAEANQKLATLRPQLAAANAEVATLKQQAVQAAGALEASRQAGETAARQCQ